MNFINKATQAALSILVLGTIITGCQKMDRPALGDYPQDASLPGGPLKFYAAYDGTTANKSMAAVDSIKANFGVVNGSGTFVTGGISGNSYQGSGGTGFIQYPSANDFTSTTTAFTVAFWIKKTPQAAGSGTNYAFALNNSGYSWTNLKLFFEFEDAGNPSTTALAAGKFYVMDQWVEYTKHTTTEDRMPKVLDGTWHHLAFTYTSSNSILLAYIDGVLFHTDKVGGPLGAVDFSGANGFTVGGPGQQAHDANTWMGNLDGQIDQFRLYGTALSASDVLALFNSKK